MCFATTTTAAAFIESLLASLPEIALIAVACWLVVQGLAISARSVHVMTALAGIGVAMLLAALPYALHAFDFHDAAARFESKSSFAEYVRWLVLASGGLLVLASTRDAATGIAAEYYASLFVALAGTAFVARADDLVTLYLALEMISIPTYVMLYLPSRSLAAQEAAAKYFLLSVLSSGLMLFGFSYLYGLAGTTEITAMVETLRSAHIAGASPMAVLAMVLVVAGLAFRITAVPFHYYAPDVYQGAPTSVVSMLAVLPKIAGFAAFARLLGFTTFPVDDLPFPATTQIPLLLWVLAAITMTVGNVLALIQDHLKRMMAYSGVAHAGYMIMGLLAASAETASTDRYVAGLDALLVYLAAYALMTIGLFAAISFFDTPGRPTAAVDDLAGVGRIHPIVSASLAVCLLSLIGLPLTAGFTGKLLLFYSLFDTGAAGLSVMNTGLIAIAALNAAIGAVYYLRIFAVIYLRSPLNPDEKGRGMGPALAVVICALGTLILGIGAEMIVIAARAASPMGP
jgi:NADH-quinone oxidoreductase subunit N